MDKSQTTSSQAKLFHAVLTILGILALAMMMTPEPEGLWTRIKKFLQVRPKIQHTQITAKRL